MLEQHEWEIVVKAHNAKSNTDPDVALGVLKSEAAKLGIAPPLALPADARPIARFGWHLIAGYHMFTGVLYDSPNPVWHHVVSLHGPPCSNCGKLLRTKKASYCVACGTSVSD